MSNPKVYYWCGAVDKKYEVKVIPCGTQKLINFATKQSKTHRDDMDGIVYNFYSDTSFVIHISSGKNTIAHLDSEETLKYWYSTLDDAVKKAKSWLHEEGDRYYVYKTADNLYEMHMEEFKFKGEPVAVVDFEINNDPKPCQA